MRIDSLTSTAGHLILRPPVVVRSRGGEGQEVKSLGETPPIPLNLEDIGALAKFFGPTGLVGRLRKRLNYLKRKKCIVIPAKGGNSCVDDEDVVYLGVDLLAAHLKEPETLAGVLAHEWGHACALKPPQGAVQKLNWNQIFELRRAHETLADEIAGRLLFMMGFTTKGLIRFLTERKKDTHNLKYHAPEIRARVIQYGFEVEKRKAELAKRLFSKSIYPDQYRSILLDIA